MLIGKWICISGRLRHDLTSDDANSMLVEPEKFSTLSHLATLPEIRERHFEGFARMSAISVASSDDEKKKAAEELMKKLG